MINKNMKTERWERFKKNSLSIPMLQMNLDFNGMIIPDNYFTTMEPLIQKAYSEMNALENGAVANIDENRMVGTYWLRAPELAPTKEIKHNILDTFNRIKEFAEFIKLGLVRPSKDEKFTNFLLIGIGGSALGPQLLSEIFYKKKRGLTPYFIDNTDPDGIDNTLLNIGEKIKNTLVIVISKSGGTIETRNGLLEVERYFEQQGLLFSKQAVAITMPGSKLHEKALAKKWLSCFHLWDWVGGRTSITSAVGLLPAALLGIDIDNFIAGACSCDEATRKKDTLSNPAAILSLIWYNATKGQGDKNMVILPYKDSLRLLPSYLQQLIMESLGKETDRAGLIVKQGITVYGNKGSTDQHAYLQQLVEGNDNFFVTFIQVFSDKRKEQVFVESNITSNDYLQAFLQGTKNSLSMHGKKSLLISLYDLNEFSLGALLALFERTVGYYAELININPYHQPGVEQGKQSAKKIINLQMKLLQIFANNPAKYWSVQELADYLDDYYELETIFELLEYMSCDGKGRIKKEKGSTNFDSLYIAASLPK